MAFLSNPSPRCAALVTALLLAGCAGGRDRFPSLAVRPAERAFGSAQPANPAPAPDAAQPLPATVSVVQRVAALKDQAADARRTFDAARPQAARLASAARGAAPGSEAWSVAQVALAKLDSARSQAMVAMADLDRMLVVSAQAAVEGSDSDLKLVQAAQAEVSSQIADQDATIAALRSQVAG